MNVEFIIHIIWKSMAEILRDQRGIPHSFAGMSIGDVLGCMERAAVFDINNNTGPATLHVIYHPMLRDNHRMGSETSDELFTHAEKLMWSLQWAQEPQFADEYEFYYTFVRELMYENGSHQFFKVVNLVYWLFYVNLKPRHQCIKHQKYHANDNRFKKDVTALLDMVTAEFN